MKICSVEGCGLKHEAKGFCGRHYKVNQRLVSPEVVREKARQSRLRNLEKARARRMAWHAKNRELSLEKMRAYHQSLDKEKVRQSRADWYVANKAKVKADTRRWAKENPETVTAYKSAYKARKRGAEGEHTGDEIKALFFRQRGKCASCRTALPKNYHKDHIQPLIAGGSNWIENIQLLCPSCNTSKRAKDPVEFMQSRGFLL